MAEDKEGIIEGWSPPEEHDYAVRRRIQQAKSKSNPVTMGGYFKEIGFKTAFEQLPPGQQMVYQNGIELVRAKLEAVNKNKK